MPSKKDKKKPKGRSTKKPTYPNRYRSGFEKTVADSLTKRKVKFYYENKKIEYVVPESKHLYCPDFELSNGIVVECKGKLDADARKKMALVKAQWPDLDLRILFMRDQPIRKGSKTMYSEWATKLGYKFAFKDIPDEWLN